MAEGAKDDVFPDRSMALRDKFAWMIETTGWLLEPVQANLDTDPPLPPYGYTIGFEETYGFGEVCIVGLKPVAAKGLAGLVAQVLAGGTQPPIGELFLGLYDGDQRAALLPVDTGAMAGMFEGCDAWYGDRPYRMTQLVWPDPSGFLPWEPGFDPQLAGVQLLFGEAPDPG